MKTGETMKHTHKRSEFTPGPWTIEAYQYNGAFYIQQPDDQTNGGWVVATIWGDDREANARLIGAAPDLKNALEIALATIERLAPSHRGFDSTRGTKDVVLAALAKAEGLQ